MSEKTIITAKGETFNQLLVNAVRAISQVLAGDSQLVGESFSERIIIHSVDEETLLVDLISKLIELAYMENVVATDFVIEKCTDKELEGELLGKRIDQEIKELRELAFDELSITQDDDGFQATMPFIG